MSWLIGFSIYAIALIAVVVIAAGRRRSDVHHAKAIDDLAALEAQGAVRVEPKRARVRMQTAGASNSTHLHRNAS